MARNRIIYQSEALYAGPSPATGDHFSAGNGGNNLVNQLHRVQSANYSFNIARQDVNQFGELASKYRTNPSFTIFGPDHPPPTVLILFYWCSPFLC